VPVENIDAIEAASQFVPEPALWALALLALATIVNAIRK
jgi:hypothetical protein